MAVWRIQSLHHSRTQAQYLVVTYGVVWEQVYGMLRQVALLESRVFTAYTGDDTAIYGAARYLPDRIGHLYECQPPTTLRHHAARGPTAPLVSYRGGWYIEA